MTEKTPDPAAGAPHASSGPTRWEGAGGGLVSPCNDLAAASEKLLGGGARQLDSAALRDALLTCTILAHHKGNRDRDHRHQWVRDRRHRWAGAGRAAAVLGTSI